jgi:hypothetical protein
MKVGNTLKKCYITLFTCATTRAVHLQLCLDLSTNKLLLALQRFTGRRGLPNTIYTDNAQTFHAANRELRELCSPFSRKDTPVFCGTGNPLEVYYPPGGMVGRLVEANGRQD